MEIKEELETKVKMGIQIELVAEEDSMVINMGGIILTTRMCWKKRDTLP